MLHPTVLSVRIFAKEAHKGQLRKYTGEPYSNHCEEVAELVERNGGSVDQIAAAYLHDVVEDTSYTLEDIYGEFGNKIAHLVDWLTDVSKPRDGNRATRKRLDREHIANAPAEAQTIKLADLISNTRTIVKYDPDFAKVYLREKMLLLDVLGKGHRGLWAQAWTMARDGQAQIEQGALDKAAGSPGRI